MANILNHVYEAIGNTPIVRLSRITAHYGVQGEILAKLEYLNPGFSKKDRPALQMIEEAEASGELRPGQPVVELTSGNTGTGLSIVCKAKGHPFIACMSEGNSTERARMMRALGAEIILVPQLPTSKKGQVSGGDLALVEQRAQQVAKERGAFRADQFKLHGTESAHRLHTAVEIWAQCDGELDVFLDFLGSGGTFVGCAKGLKAFNPAIRCYAVEPETAAHYANKPTVNGGAHKIQGAGYNMELPIMEPGLIDGLVQVGDEECIEAARNLARLEGAFVGFSSGANVCAAIKLLKAEEKGKRIALTLNDSGLKYLSTDLYPPL